MLASLKKIFETNTIEINESDESIPLHSNTSAAQGVFLQKIFDAVKPSQSIEVGFAYGVSTLFILEKHRQYNSKDAAHIVIEPFDAWGTAAEYNIEKEGLTRFMHLQRDFSDKVLAKLFLQNHRVQFAYIDTTKLFDVIMHDFYFIDKMLDTGGVIILDDCGGGWPGVQRAARFFSKLPHYHIMDVHNKIVVSGKRRFIKKILSLLIALIPFKKRIFPATDFSTDEKLGLDYSCIAFKKIAEDKREWNWDKPM